MIGGRIRFALLIPSQGILQPTDVMMIAFDSCSTGTSASGSRLSSADAIEFGILRSPSPTMSKKMATFF